MVSRSLARRSNSSGLSSWSASLLSKRLRRKPEQTARDVHHLADQVAVDSGDEILEVEIDISEIVGQLGCQVVAESIDVEVSGVGFGGDEGAA